MKRAHPVRLLPMLLAGLLISLGTASPANAAEVVTPYPTVRAQAGQATTFDLQILSDEREPVDLRVSEAPDGWDTVFRGGGREIEAVYTTPGEAAEAQLEVQVPDDAKPGTYDVTVAANAGSGDDRLQLGLRVVEQASDAFELGTEFNTLRGSGSDTFRFDLTLANHTAQEASFSLSATGPQGWEITASPSAEQQAATATVDAGGQSTIVVEASPPEDVAAGSYEIGVEASGQGTTLQSTLTAEVAGSPSLTLTTASERLNASGSAGGTGTVTVVVQNDGNAPVEGVELSATPPSNWEVSFEPSTIPAIGPGERAQATARITPTSDAVAGDYVVTVNAATGGGNDSMELRYAVETSGWWGLVGILVILLALGALFWVYRRYGRR